MAINIVEVGVEQCKFNKVKGLLYMLTEKEMGNLSNALR
jgi:hypothetical protein